MEVGNVKWSLLVFCGGGDSLCCQWSVMSGEGCDDFGDYCQLRLDDLLSLAMVMSSETTPRTRALAGI